MDFKFPDVGEGITEGEIVKWRVKQGDNVKQDQILVEIETDKAVVEIPSPQSGIITKINHKEGETVKVGEVLVVIGEKEIQKPQKEKSVSVVGQLEEAVEEILRPERGETLQEEKKTQETKKEKVLATPVTRKLAKDMGVDINEIKGTGKDGRITDEDVQNAKTKSDTKPVTKSDMQAQKPSGIRIERKYDFYGMIERVPFRGIRKATAKNMSKSMTDAAHVSSMDEADVTHLWGIHEKEKNIAAKKGIHLTFLPFIIKAVIAGLKNHPYLNSSLDEEKDVIILKKYYNIGVAVDVGEGLLVPVIKEAQDKNILDIAKEIYDVAEKAKARKLDLSDMKGGTFTITNIGSIGGLFFTPIINPSEAAILGMGKIHDKIIIKDGKVRIRKALPLSLSFDHKILDGAEAARFMKTVIEHLEDPDMLIIEGN